MAYPSDKGDNRWISGIDYQIYKCDASVPSTCPPTVATRHGVAKVTERMKFEFDWAEPCAATAACLKFTRMSEPSIPNPKN